MVIQATTRCLYTALAVIVFWSLFTEPPHIKFGGLRIERIWLDLLGVPVLYLIFWYLTRQAEDLQDGIEATTVVSQHKPIEPISGLSPMSSLVPLCLGIFTGWLYGAIWWDALVVAVLGGFITAGGFMYEKLGLVRLTIKCVLIWMAVSLTIQVNALAALGVVAVTAMIGALIGMLLAAAKDAYGGSNEWERGEHPPTADHGYDDRGIQ